jgi:tRNA 5-methylaminomethyl-2-thiouridine biosynthesis bifunctional protein
MLFARLGLPEAWQARTRYTLLMMELRDGESFIRLWERWKQDPRRPDRLHVVALSVSLVDASVLRARLLAQMPLSLHAMVEQLVAQWPLNLPGTHRLDFEGLAVTLTIAVGPPAVTLPRLAVAADAIWRGEEVPAEFPDHRLRARVSPTDRMLRLAIDPHEARHAVVVGAGIAGASVAHALALRGWRVQVLDLSLRRQQEHAAHVAAALTPMVTRDDDIRARLSRAGSLRAHARWSRLSEDILWQCGALQLQRISGRIVDLKSLVADLSFPTEWLRFVETSEASALAGLELNRGGLFFPTAARIRPERLIEMLLATPGVERLEVHVERVERVDGQWHVLNEQGETCAVAPRLILAGAVDTQDILRRSALLEPRTRLSEMHALGGEITILPERILAGGPRCIVSGDGYILPSLEGQCVVGSSYVHGGQSTTPTMAGALGNIERAADLLGQAQLPAMFNNLGQARLKGWAGRRAVLPSRIPFVGPLADTEGLWVATGFASRGLTWSTLAGDLIAAALNGEPLPLERDIMDKISQT